MNHNPSDLEQQEKIYCRYCKEEIDLNDDFVVKRHGEYHRECWLQKHNKIKELDFS